MRMTQIGYLCKGDTFYYEGQRYRINSISYCKSVNNVNCTNLKTHKIKWFDCDSDVEVVV